MVNSTTSRHEFVINNKEVQFLIVKNTDAVHGREEVEEGDRGNRFVIGIPLQKQKPSTTMGISGDVYRPDDNSKFESR